jgi:hypothetical protein
MRKSYSYEGILSAVGRVLDDAGVTGIAIHETDEGLLVEGLDRAGQSRVSMPFAVPQLYALIAEPEAPAISRATTHDEGTLRQFLDQHELVGAR